MRQEDIRWVQRYDSFSRACSRILEVTESARAAEQLSELEQEGLIQRFEYTVELAWKVLQDLLRERGYGDFVPGPNGVLKKAFEIGLISDHDGWRKMAKARTATAHVYDAANALEAVGEIYDVHSKLLKRLREKLAEELTNR